jgi:hypothetical protein
MGIDLFASAPPGAVVRDVEYHSQSTTRNLTAHTSSTTCAQRMQRSDGNWV